MDLADDAGVAPPPTGEADAPADIGADDAADHPKIDKSPMSPLGLLHDTNVALEDDTIEPASSSSAPAVRNSAARGPIVNQTPDYLAEAVPPGCTLHLNCALACTGLEFPHFCKKVVYVCFVVLNSFVLSANQGNDHRFTVNFPSLGVASMSRSFDKSNESSWMNAFKNVHRHAWSQWNKYSVHHECHLALLDFVISLVGSLICFCWRCVILINAKIGSNIFCCSLILPRPSVAT